MYHGLLDCSYPESHQIVSFRGCKTGGFGGAFDGLLKPRFCKQGRVAQLVRALVSHTRGPGFKSLRDHHRSITQSLIPDVL